MSSIARFARSSAGRQAARKAMQFAQSPEGKRRIAEVRERVAARGKPRR
jgi:hypothetical protein